MTPHDATEAAYRNGFKHGKQFLARELLKDIEFNKKTRPNFDVYSFVLGALKDYYTEDETDTNK